MAKGNVGSLLVFDPAKIDFGSDEKVKSAAGDAVVGIVTERGQQWVLDFVVSKHKTMLPAFIVKAVPDLTPVFPDYLTKVVVKGKSSTSVHVKDVMTPASRLMTVTPNHSVLEVMSMMNDNNFRHVPVVCQSSYSSVLPHTATYQTCVSAFLAESACVSIEAEQQLLVQCGALNQL